MSQYTVFVNGIEVYAYHGVPPEERAIGHRLIIDLEVEVDAIGPTTDDVSDTVDYGSLGAKAAAFVQSNQVQTLERLAQMLGEHLLETEPLARAIEVVIAKPMPPMPVIAKSAGVRIKICRH